MKLLKNEKKKKKAKQTKKKPFQKQDSIVFISFYRGQDGEPAVWGGGERPAVGADRNTHSPRNGGGVGV